MSNASINKELKKLWPLLTITQKKAVMKMINNYLEESDAIIPELGVSYSEYNKELEEGEAEIERGEFYTHEQVKEQIEEWKKGYKK